VARRRRPEPHGVRSVPWAPFGAKFFRRSDAQRDSNGRGPRPLGVYSQAIVCDGFVFVAVQGPINPATNEMERGDIRPETRRVLRNTYAILRASGSSLRDALRVGVFLSDLADFSAMNEVFREFFPENPPARTTVGCDLPRIKVEIDCVARLRKGRTAKGR
jgi:2-iminobutanoate/2-iminopropanoate deaminase